MSGIFLSWTSWNGRTADLARTLGITPHFIFRPSRFGTAARYVAQARDTRKLLRGSGQECVVVMLPPPFALWSVRPARRRGGQIIADLHSGFFLDPKWTWATRITLRTLRRWKATAIVTNEHLRVQCEKAGVRAVILHDIIDPEVMHRSLPYGSVEAQDHLVDLQQTAIVLCPVSYANDEPISELLEAARATPDLSWYFTGSAPQDVMVDAPGNVTFTGYVDYSAYCQLLRASSVVVALTRRPHTMQRAGYESLNYAVPLVTSNFPELREFFDDTAYFTDPIPGSIALAVRAAVAEGAEVRPRITALRSQRQSEQVDALKVLRGQLSAPGIDNGALIT